MLEISLGLSAWKEYGPDRWALRCNPSSGNLHPTEAYILSRNVPGIVDGLHHYLSRDHVLELRCQSNSRSEAPARLWVGLSSVQWREAWKYGERAFRYCQLDTGHAVGALRYAAELLGWVLAEQRQVGGVTLAHLLGLDRAQDFPSPRHVATEREEAEILLAVSPSPLDVADLQQACAAARWHGPASAIDPHPMFDWPAVEAVASATRMTTVAAEPPPLQPISRPSPLGRDIAAAGLILQRRSAQRFDARHVMPRADFFALLDTVLPTKRMPWDALATTPHISLVLFVHRVDVLQPGLYLLPRVARLTALLDESLDARLLRSAVDAAPPHLGLQLLVTAPSAELHRAARSLNCHQDIAANACFALGMLAEFDATVSSDPAAYRDLYREAGRIGQVLYLQAEALGLRGTGIGCYFDDPFHELLGLSGKRFQSLYHFTVGLPLDDPRIETSIPFTMRPTP
ncbi:nitroreductase family protein [mine drainage metagenome]|uniref:Nitroreductase family protein n=1 Tax=mine drainage metagenome TaxID=410659 RepID=A0A1J5PJN3_9ZZZZ